MASGAPQHCIRDIDATTLTRAGSQSSMPAEAAQEHSAAVPLVNSYLIHKTAACVLRTFRFVLLKFQLSEAAAVM